MTIFNQETPVTVRDAFKGTSLESYHTRNRERWQKAAPSKKRTSTFYSLLGILSLSAVTTLATLHS
jgi:hypothetical protein